MRHVYLDYAATTPMDPEVINEIEKHLRETYGNPSSLHTDGQIAHQILEKCRKEIAQFINAKENEIIFTSSGTESNNLAIKGIAFKNRNRGNHIITSKIEHHSVLHTCQYLEKEGFNVSYISVDKDGLINIKELEEQITERTILISIIFANNEIGTIEPIKEIGKIAKSHKILFHTDAVQAFGKIPINVEELNIDLLSASGHKIYGPKGVGMLYVRGGGSKKNIGKYIEPLFHGGGHEKGLRSSTENTPGIVGFTKAVEICNQNMEIDHNKLLQFRDKIISKITNEIEDVYLNGHPTKRLSNNVNLGFRYVEGESILLSLDLEGISVSTGSACSSKSLEASHVLLAIGQKPEEAHGSIRITLGRFTTEQEIEYLLEIIPGIISHLRKMSPLKKGKKYLLNDSNLHCDD